MFGRIILFKIQLITFLLFLNANAQQELKYINSTLWTFNSDVLVEGNILYTSMDIGLQIWDITDKANPSQLSQLYFKTGSGQGLEKEGNYIYMAYEEGGVKIIDVSDPSNPVLAHEITGYGTVYDLHLVDDTLYTVSNRAAVNIFAMDGPTTHNSIGAFDLGGATSDIKVKDNYIYLPYSSTGSNGCYVIDIKIKWIPMMVDTLLSSAAWPEFL